MSLRVGGEEEGDGRRPPVIPFDFSDFVREDVAPSPAADRRSPAPALKPSPAPDTRAADNSAQPTGYGSDDDDDLPQEDQYPSAVPRLLRDLYLPSPFDSNSRRQAKLLARNITFFSLAIGVIFTALWYLSPVKFVSLNDRPASTQPVSLPEGLIERGTEGTQRSLGNLLDDGIGIPNDNLQRIPYQDSQQSKTSGVFQAQDI